MARSNRMKRVDDLVREVIGEALLSKVADPRIGMVSVTKVEVSPEFDTARVWVTVLGDEAEREQTMRGLASASRFLQSEIGKSTRIRRVPRLRFLYDDSLDRGFRVDATLRELRDGDEWNGEKPESGDEDA